MRRFISYFPGAIDTVCVHQPPPACPRSTGVQPVKSPLISTRVADGACTLSNTAPWGRASATKASAAGKGLPGTSVGRLSLSTLVAAFRRPDARRIPSDTKRPPGKPCVGSTGYVPPAPTIPSTGVAHAVMAMLAHVRVPVGSNGNLEPHRVAANADTSRRSRVRVNES